MHKDPLNDEESKENIDAIIFTLNAAKIILSNGLNLLGIKPIEKM